MRTIEWLKILILAQGLDCVFPGGLQAYTKYCRGSQYNEQDAANECKKNNKHLAITRTDTDLYHAATAQCESGGCTGKDRYWIGLKYNKNRKTFYRFNNQTVDIPVYTAHTTKSCDNADRKCVHLHIQDGNYVKEIHCEKCETKVDCVICKNNSAPETTPEPQPEQEYTKYCNDNSKYTINQAKNKCSDEGKHLATVKTDSDLYDAVTAQCAVNKCKDGNYWIGLTYDNSLKTFYRYDDMGSIPVYTAHETSGCNNEKQHAFLKIKSKTIIEKIECKDDTNKEACVICKNESVPVMSSRTWSTHKNVHPTTSPNRSSRFRTQSSKLITGGIHFTTVPLFDSARSQSITPLSPPPGQVETSTLFRSSPVLQTTRHIPSSTPGQHHISTNNKRSIPSVQTTQLLSSTPEQEGTFTTTNTSSLILQTTQLLSSTPGQGDISIFSTNNTPILQTTSPLSSNPAQDGTCKTISATSHTPSPTWKYHSSSATLSQLEKQQCRNAMNASLKVVNNRIEDTVENNYFSFLSIIRKWEDFNLSCSPFIKEELEVTRKDLGVVMVTLLVSASDVKNKRSFNFSRSEFELELPGELFQGEGRRIVALLSNETAHRLPQETHRMIDGQNGTRDLVSPLLTLTLQPRLPPLLDRNITLTIRHLKNLTGEPYFVFWNFSIKSKFNGSWSSRGCTIKRSNETETVGSCNHLTTFAVLMQVNEQQSSQKQLSAVDKLALDIIFYIGSALSLIGEVFALLIYMVLFDYGIKGSATIRVRINLFSSLIAAHVTFISGIESTDNKAVCIFVSALLHYLYLVAMDWMLVEGLIMYTKIVKVFNIFTKTAFLYVFAWGFPVVVVLLSLIIASASTGGIHDNYIQDNICWLSTSNNLIWAFAAPVSVVVLLNTIIIILIVRELSTLQNVGNGEVNKVRQAIRASILITPVLGVTWIFGLLAVGGAGPAFTYIFIILTSLQGFLIFIFQVLMNKEVRAAFQLKKQKWIAKNQVLQSQTNSKRSSKVGISGPCNEQISLNQLYANFESKGYEC